ncbi:MAG TPA: DMT family transporter [Oscillatoriaceae cyanobacterium]
MTDALPSTSRRWAIAQMILCTFFWGAFFVFGKLAVREAPPLAVATLRFLVAGAVLLGVLAWREPGAFRLPRRDWGLALALGATGVAAYNALAFAGMPLAPASDGAMISPSLNPVLTAALAAWIFREAFSPKRAVGLVLAIAGIAFIFVGPLLHAAASPTRWQGDALFLASAVCWSIYTLVGKLTVGRFSALASTTYASVVGALLLLPFSARELAGVHWAALTPAFWGAIVVLALLCTVAAFLFWYVAIDALGASGTAAFLPLVPLFGVALGMAMLGDRPGPLQWIGMALALTGVALAAGIKLPGVRRD